MKKAIQKMLALGLLVLLGTVSFANTDLQLQTGLRSTNLDFENDDSWLDIGGNYDFLGFDVALSSYTLFDIGEVFSLGFMNALSFGIDDSTDDDFDFGAANFDFLTGPAFGLTIGNIVRFQGMVGFDVGLKLFMWEKSYYYDDDSDVGGAFGIATEIQAKFFPHSIVSPILGARGIASFSSLTVRNTDFDVAQTSGIFYLGASLNFRR